VAIEDMFLKVLGVTGETADPKHKGEIEVVSWSWGLQAPSSISTGRAIAATNVSELRIVKRVDQSSVTLMRFLRDNKMVEPGDLGNRVTASALLTIRKAGDGGTQLEYLKVELDNVRVTSVRLEATHGGLGSAGPEVVEVVTLSFSKVRVSYVPQSATGGAGGGANMFEVDAHHGTPS
jgi:type VI secretion system secreted protein Hcp